MEVKIVNLTPHEVVLIGEGGVLARIPPSGKVARVAVKSVTVGSLLGAPVRKTEYGEVEGLPEPTPGTVYIVSTVVLLALAAKGVRRNDVVAPDTSPGSAVRDPNGNIIGVKGWNTL